jgi:quercetin dioxygenase-like cupin family protein
MAKRLPFAIYILFLVASIARAQDPVKVSPEHYKVEIDNDQVRVLRHTGGAKAKDPMHAHPANVVIYLTDADYKTTDKAGKSTEGHRKRGDFVWNDATSGHTRESLSDKPFEIIQIELKPGKSRQKSAAVALDPVKLSPSFYKVEFENDSVRIIRAKRPPHSKVPMHAHPSYAAVYLTPVHQKTTDSEGKVSDSVRKSGDVSFNKPLQHAEENISDQPFEAVIVELK